MERDSCEKCLLGNLHTKCSSRLSHLTSSRRTSPASTAPCSAAHPVSVSPAELCWRAPEGRDEYMPCAARQPSRTLRANKVCRCGAGAGAPFWAGSSLRPPPRARPAPADGFWSCSPLSSCLRSFPALCSRRWLHRHGQLQHHDAVIVGRRHSLRRYAAFVDSASAAAPDQ